METSIKYENDIQKPHCLLLSVTGHDEALLGLGLSYGITSNISLEEFVNNCVLKKRVINISKQLAGKGNGHDKFMRQINIIWDLNLPLYLWSQFDTYKIGTTAQSESKMHTMHKMHLQQHNFYNNITEEELEEFNALPTIKKLEQIRFDFLQRRIVTMNVAVFLNIYRQRHDHKLNLWEWLCKTMWSQLKNTTVAEFLIDVIKGIDNE